MKVKHINQDCGSSCGPASLKMIMSTVNYLNKLTIQNIFDQSPTRIGGTPWFRMSNIIDKLEIKHKVLINLSTDYFKNKPDNKKWMLAIYYGDSIKHWVVLDYWDSDKNKFIINDPAGDRIEMSEEELKYTFYKRGGLAIEFDLNDFIGNSENKDKKNAEKIMSIIDSEVMRLNIDSNFILGKRGYEVTLDEFIESIESDQDNDSFVYSIVDRENFLKEGYKPMVKSLKNSKSKIEDPINYIFGYNNKKLILINFGENHEYVVKNSNLEI